MNSIDSKTVSKAIKQIVWARLKTIGFTKFTTRSAWRFEGRSIQVINFQSFNSYLASTVGCTTFSFALNLGLHFVFLPLGGGDEYSDRDHPPTEHQCLFRKPLRTPFKQMNNESPNVWSIDPEGGNVVLYITNALKMIELEGLPWFVELRDPKNALRILETDDEQFDKFGPSGTWGFGRPHSPMRQRAITRITETIATSPKF
jgi:hypothetical protein